MKTKRIISAVLSAVMLTGTMFVTNITASALGEVTSVKEVSSTKSGFKIKWSNKWSDLSENAITYDIKLSTAGTSLSYKSMQGNSLSITSNLTPGTSYKVTVRPRNGETVGEWSEPYIASTSCSDVSVKQTAAMKNSVTLKWNKSKGASGYKVYQQNSTTSGIKYKLLATTKSTTATVPLNKYKIKNVKQYNTALLVRPYRTTADYTAQTKAKQIASASFVKHPKTTAFSTAAPYIKSGKLVLKSNKWVNGFQYKTYTTGGKLITSGTAKSSSKSATVAVGNSDVYRVQARAYIKVNGKTYFSSWTKKTLVCPTLNLKSKWVNNTIKISWQKINGVSGYNLKLVQKNNTAVSYKKTGYKKNSIIITRKELKSIKISNKYKVAVAPYRSEKKPKATYKFSSSATNIGYIEVIGHRGIRDKAPENTLASFKAAKKAGYESFECDYWETKSGDIIICHDENLALCGHPEIDVRTITAETRKKYPVKNDPNVKKYGTQYLPTLQEVASTAYKLNMRLYLHNKDNNISEKGIEKVCKILRKYNMINRAVVFSSNKDCATRISKHNCTSGLLRLATNDKVLPNAIKYMKKNKMTWLVTRINDYLTPSVAKFAHQNGVKIGCWAVNNPTLASKQANIGADFLITDYFYLDK